MPTAPRPGSRGFAMTPCARSCWPTTPFAPACPRTGLGSPAIAAQTTFDAALAAYRSGVGSITDLTLAETQLLLAKNASADAYSTALSAAATLALATGALGQAPT